MRMLPLTAKRAIPAAGSWETIIAAAEFSHRDSCVRFEHGGFIWLSNGYQYGGNLMRDLWFSRSGLRWHRANNATPYQGYAPVASYNGQIVAVSDQVYVSDDMGVSFAVLPGSLPFTVPTSTVYTWRLLEFAGRLMLFAGNKVWHTTDLTSWLSVDLPWAERVNFGLELLQGEVHIFAGNNDVTSVPAEIGYPGKTSFNDHWKSATPLDPGSWVQVTASAPWAARMWPGTCVHGDTIVMAGGYDNRAPTNFADTWVFSGTEWRQVMTSPGFSPRHFPALFSVGGRVLLTTGNQNPNISMTTNDVLQLT